MGQIERTGAADLHGLARVQREKRWTTIMDLTLAALTVLWVVSLSVQAPALAGLHVALPVVIGLMALHRWFVVLERDRRARSAASTATHRREAVRSGVRRPVDQRSSTAA